MAIQCWMCSEILLEGKELAEAQPLVARESRRSRAISVHSGCCPECLGLVTAGVLRLWPAQNQLSAA